MASGGFSDAFAIDADQGGSATEQQMLRRAWAMLALTPDIVEWAVCAVTGNAEGSGVTDILAGRSNSTVTFFFVPDLDNSTENSGHCRGGPPGEHINAETNPITWNIHLCMIDFPEPRTDVFLTHQFFASGSFDDDAAARDSLVAMSAALILHELCHLRFIDHGSIGRSHDWKQACNQSKRIPNLWLFAIQQRWPWIAGLSTVAVPPRFNQTVTTWP